MRLAVLVILVSGAARAWDPTDAASVDSRVQELKAAWEGKDPVAVANDKLQRARQGKKPAWVSRRAFRIDDGARRLYLGIGSTKLSQATMRIAVLQDAPAAPQSATPIDWYFDEAGGTFYSLTVEEKR